MKFTFPPESKPLPGFTIKRAVHRGGFGEVYYALTDAGKEVALKLLNQHTDVELRGATACLNLNHPNLVTIYDIKDDADGDHWIVMEYVGGKRLCDALEEKGKLPVEEIERWLDGMTAGLTFLHDKGIVHRDLKPSNVFSENGVVKVGDVGLSKFISESRKSAHTQSVGTVYYMAPEVARGRYGREVDVYALGVILYEALVGEVPFDGESTGEILMKHLSSPPDLSKLPARVRPVLARALEKDPQRRTATVARLRDEFKAAVRGRVIDGDDPQEIPEDSFLDGAPGGRQDQLRREVRDYVSAAQADAEAYARRTQERAAEYARQRARVQTAKYAPPPGREPWRGQVAGAYADANRHWPHKTCGVAATAARRHSESTPGERNWTPVIVIGAVAAFLLFTRGGRQMMPSLWEGAILAAVAYGVYSVVRWAGIGRRASAPVITPSPTPTPPAQTAPLAAAPVQMVAQRRPAIPTPEALRVIPARQRMSQLTGSMTVAALVSAVITSLLAPLGFVSDLSSAVLFGSTATLASWAVMAVAKWTEGTGTDATARRLLQAAAGLVVGGMAYGLDQFLLADFTHDGSSGQYYGFVTEVGDLRFAGADNEPALAAYLSFFAALFALRRWWWQADAYRSKRLKISSSLLTALLGYVLTAVIYFPHAWGIVWAVVISCVVQLAAAWTPPENRRPATVTLPAQPAA
jgi:hypothetical protein